MLDLDCGKQRVGVSVFGQGEVAVEDHSMSYGVEGGPDLPACSQALRALERHGIAVGFLVVQ